MGVEDVLARRRAERRALLALAEQYTAGLDETLGVRAAVVYGSVARGDFNLWSDVDVLVVARHLPSRLLERLERLDPRPPRVQPLAWTPEEWGHELARGNPIAREASERGVWLVGSPERL